MHFTATERREGFEDKGFIRVGNLMRNRSVNWCFDGFGEEIKVGLIVVVVVFVMAAWVLCVGLGKTFRLSLA